MKIKKFPLTLTLLIAFSSSTLTICSENQGYFSWFKSAPQRALQQVSSYSSSAGAYLYQQIASLVNKLSEHYKLVLLGTLAAGLGYVIYKKHPDMPSNTTENKPIQPHKALLIAKFPDMSWDKMQISEQNAETLLHHLTHLDTVESHLKRVPDSKNLNILKRWLKKEIDTITDNPNADFSRPTNYLAPHDKPYFKMLTRKYHYLIPENIEFSEEEAKMLSNYLDGLENIELQLEENYTDLRLLALRKQLEDRIKQQLNIKKINFF